ncbi:hypothetical protein ABZ208_02705 [Streptomyces sp. NPDC006208]|uniref:hypothetical protein n=1 Tax=Streptomyces sp. NPDC006208 TaxID=3156734 RepID=UPI0033AAA490
MPFFAKAAWPGDHRDEIVAGVLVGAVVVVLGYASGIGAGGSVAGQETQAVGPPAATAPPGTEQPSGPAESQSAEPPAVDQPVGGGDIGWAADMTVPVLPPGAGMPGHGHGGGEHGDDEGHTGGEEHTGGGPGPGPGPSVPGSAAPTPSAPCSDGEVHLAEPLLTGVLDLVPGTLSGLLGGGTPPDPEPRPAPPICTGLEAAVASPSPGATP